MIEQADAKRRFLVLQGPTRFFGELGRALATQGHSVQRIFFTAGDRLSWRLPGAISFRRSISDWPDFLEARLEAWGITDIILFGDCRPLHVVAIRVAARRDIRVHVFEEGYLRPDWITFEQGGVNGYSALPRDPAFYREAATTLPSWRTGVAVAGGLRSRAAEIAISQLWSLLFAWRYPGYRTHLPRHPIALGAGWIRRIAGAPIRHHRTRKMLSALAVTPRPYYLLPLQLDGDSQIRRHSPLGRMAPALRVAIRSFAQHAPTDTFLVIKEHPFDCRLQDWRRIAHATAAHCGIEDRVGYIEGGPLGTLIANSRGIVTVNSTVGLSALSRGVPVIALGKAIYDLPGLTHQTGIDRFWQEGTAPDRRLVASFCHVMARLTQINGDFFSRAGRRLAVAGAVARIGAAASLADEPIRPTGEPLQQVQLRPNPA